MIYKMKSIMAHNLLTLHIQILLTILWESWSFFSDQNVIFTISRELHTCLELVLNRLEYR